MDRDVLVRALRRLLPELASFTRWLAGSVDEADELTQEVVLRALRHARSIEDPERLRAWLFRTTRNVRTDLFRSGRARGRLLVLGGDAEDASDVRVPLDPLPAAIDRIDVERALAHLPEPARAAVLLADLWQFSYEDIARILDVPVNTVRSRVARARARLAQALIGDAARAVKGGRSA